MAREAAEPTGRRSVADLSRTGVSASFIDVGAGPPVILLHGGLEDGTAWDHFVPELAEGHRVIVPDRRGHGATPDVEGPYSYDLMAEETAELLDHLGTGPA